VVTVVGIANVPAFASYELQYGISHDPGAFSAAIWGPVDQPSGGGVLGQWDTQSLANGPHTLRLVVRDTFGNSYERRVRVEVENPEATATTTATPAITPTWTPTWTSTPEVIAPTATPIPEVAPPTPTPEPPSGGPIEPPSPLPTPSGSP